MRNVTKLLHNVTEPLRQRYGSVTGRYGTLECCRTLRRKCYGVLRSITEHYRALQNVTGALRSPYRTYGTVTDNTDFAHHQLKFKFCSSLKCRQTLPTLHCTNRSSPPPQKNISDITDLHQYLHLISAAGNTCCSCLW